MKNEFVTYEIALRMKIIGFDEPCLACYVDEENTNEVSFTFNTYNCEQLIGDNPLKKNSHYNNSITAPTWQQTFNWIYEKYNHLILVEEFYVENRLSWRLHKEHLELKLRNLIQIIEKQYETN